MDAVKAYLAGAALVGLGVLATVISYGAFTPAAVFIAGVGMGLISAGVSTAMMTYQQMRTQGCITATVSDYLENAAAGFLTGFVAGTVGKLTGGIVDKFGATIKLPGTVGKVASYAAKYQANYYLNFAGDMLVQGITTGKVDITRAKQSAKLDSLILLGADGIGAVARNWKSIKQTASGVKEKIATGLSKVKVKAGNVLSGAASKVKALATKVDDFASTHGLRGFWRNEVGEVDLDALSSRLIRNESSGLGEIVDTSSQISAKELSNLRQKAVRDAWKQERELVRKYGVGSRDWTPDEIQELLDTGRVKGYEGQHMKSAKMYPQYAGNPNNIQFLKGRTMDVNEHLDAHMGNYQNPTNWYYDPKTGVYIDFGEYVPW